MDTKTRVLQKSYLKQLLQFLVYKSLVTYFENTLFLCQSTFVDISFW